MTFMDMGIGEILLILVVVVLIWGPGKIPEATRNLGKIMNTLRKTSAEVTTALKKELEAEEREQKTQRKSADDTPESTESVSDDTPVDSEIPDKQDEKNE